MKITIENQMILACAKLKINDEAENNIRSIISNDIDWNVLLKIANRLRLKNLIYYHLQRICPENVPDEIMESLKSYYSLNAKKNLFMFGKLNEILDILELNKIKALPYKGPVLAQLIYGNLALREFDDLDIFVDKEDVSKIKEILISIGYLPKIDLNPTEEKKFIQTMRDYIFYHEKYDITLEIHWRFPSIYFSLPNKPELFKWNDCTYINLHSKSIMISSPEDMFLILCIHNAEHRWSRLSLICDFREFFISNKIDLKKLLIKSKKLGIQRIVLINFYLAKVLLDLTLSEKLIKEIKSDMTVKKISIYIISRMFSDDTQTIDLQEEAFMSYKLRENKLFGLKDIIRGVSFPGILEWEEIKLPVSLFPLYYIIRPFFLLKRYYI